MPALRWALPRRHQGWRDAALALTPDLSLLFRGRPEDDVLAPSHSPSPEDVPVFLPTLPSLSSLMAPLSCLCCNGRCYGGTKNGMVAPLPFYSPSPLPWQWEDMPASSPMSSTRCCDVVAVPSPSYLPSPQRRLVHCAPLLRWKDMSASLQIPLSPLPLLVPSPSPLPLPRLHCIGLCCSGTEDVMAALLYLHLPLYVQGVAAEMNVSQREAVLRIRYCIPCNLPLHCHCHWCRVEVYIVR